MELPSTLISSTQTFYWGQVQLFIFYICRDVTLLYAISDTERNLRKKLPYMPGIAKETLKVSLIHSRFYYFHLTLRIYATLP